jgi:hypothetical protein
VQSAPLMGVRAGAKDTFGRKYLLAARSAWPR